MHTALKKRRIVDAILTKVALGYNLDQQYSGHHLFPDVSVNAFGGKITKFGKEAFIIVNSKTAPGGLILGTGVSYEGDDYVLNIRKLKAQVAIEHLKASEKVPNVRLKSRAVNTVMKKMRLEGENDKAILATTATNYPTGHVESLSGASQWNDPTADVATQMNDAKAVVRSKIGQEPNVLHLDYKGYLGLKNNEAIKKATLPNGKGTLNEKLIAEYLDLEKVVVGKAVHWDEAEQKFVDVWQTNSTLAYVAPQGQQAMEEPSFGYNYVEDGYPSVDKEYFDEDHDVWNNKVYFHDKAIITFPEAGFLFQNTTAG